MGSTDSSPVVPQEKSADCAVRMQKSVFHEYPGVSQLMEDKGCTCTDVFISVLYVNMRSINPTSKTVSMDEKFQRLKALVAREKPDLIAIVETWLKEDHSDEDVQRRLQLDDYHIIRQDRGMDNPDNAYGAGESWQGNRRGGGLLVAWRRNFPGARLQRNCAEDLEDNVMNFEITYDFQCPACSPSGRGPTKFAFTVVYRPPGVFKEQDVKEGEEYRWTPTDRIIHLPAWLSAKEAGYSGWAMVGDFNWKPADLKLMEDYGGRIVPLSHDRTHVSGGALDQVVASAGFVVHPIQVTGFVSDHAALLFRLRLGKDHPLSVTKCEAKRCN